MVFVPVFVETSGLIGQNASSFLHEKGRKISCDSDDPSSDDFFNSMPLFGHRTGKMRSQ